MIYLTYNDQPSGVYYSQVTDVCAFVNSKFNCNIRLVALLSIRGFLENRKKIKEKLPNSIVLPMIPKHSNWRLNSFILKVLFVFIGKQTIWARGIFATNIALDLKKRGQAQKVVFDARGAYKAEFEEYLNKLVHIHDDVGKLERDAIVMSDFKLAVSNSLIDHWRSDYDYSSKNHVVIPCTLSDNNNEKEVSEKDLLDLKNDLNFKSTDIVFVYSGSAADWQSMGLVDDFMMDSFSSNINIKLLILSRVNMKELKITKQFSDRIIQRWVKPNEVINYLKLSDYGILIREHSVTNMVASPTKFAEYLNAGLKVIISDKIGDFSKFIEVNRCGALYSFGLKMNNFEKTGKEERVINKELSLTFFSKNKYHNSYQKIINILS